MERREFLFNLTALASGAREIRRVAKPAPAFAKVTGRRWEVVTALGTYQTQTKVSPELQLVSPRLGVVGSTGPLIDPWGRFRVRALVPQGEQLVVAMVGATCTVSDYTREAYQP